MKCLSIKQPWAALILNGRKTLELRSWTTKHRGPLAIHAGKKVDIYGPWNPFANNAVLPTGQVLGRVNLVDVRPMTEADADAACHAYRPGLFAWVLEEPQHVEPVAMNGRLGLFDVPWPKQDT